MKDDMAGAGGASKEEEKTEETASLPLSTNDDTSELSRVKEHEREVLRLTKDSVGRRSSQETTKKQVLAAQRGNPHPAKRRSTSKTFKAKPQKDARAATAATATAVVSPPEYLSRSENVSRPGAFAQPGINATSDNEEDDTTTNNDDLFEETNDGGAMGAAPLPLEAGVSSGAATTLTARTTTTQGSVDPPSLATAADPEQYRASEPNNNIGGLSWEEPIVATLVEDDDEEYQSRRSHHHHRHHSSIPYVSGEFLEVVRKRKRKRNRVIGAVAGTIVVLVTLLVVLLVLLIERDDAIRSGGIIDPSPDPRTASPSKSQSPTHMPSLQPSLGPSLSPSVSVNPTVSFHDVIEPCFGSQGTGYLTCGCQVDNQKSFRGESPVSHRTTISGHTCANWPVVDIALGLTQDPAFCRNPDGVLRRHAWCMINATDWEYCSIESVPWCLDDSDSDPDLCGSPRIHQRDYRGTVSVTANGDSCLAWAAHGTFYIETYPFSGLTSNHCRNPDNRTGGVWCFHEKHVLVNNTNRTTTEIVADFCSVPYCG